MVSTHRLDPRIYKGVCRYFWLVLQKHVTCVQCPYIHTFIYNIHEANHYLVISPSSWNTNILGSAPAAQLAGRNATPTALFLLLIEYIKYYTPMSEPDRALLKTERTES